MQTGLTCTKPLSCGSHFVSGDFESFVYAERTRLAVHKQSFLNLLTQNGHRVTQVYCVNATGQNYLQAKIFLTRVDSQFSLSASPNS